MKLLCRPAKKLGTQDLVPGQSYKSKDKIIGHVRDILPFQCIIENLAFPSPSLARLSSQVIIALPTPTAYYNTIHIPGTRISQILLKTCQLLTSTYM